MSESLAPWLVPAFTRARSLNGHALLLHGPRGAGQFELALALACAWLCEGEGRARQAGLACGQCAGCSMIAARTHPDLLVLLPEQLQQTLGFAGEPGEGEASGVKKAPSKEIRVDAVRAAIAFAQQTSARGGVKVAVLHPAERVNAASANMLLKTLEEPPGRARFILCSAAPQRLLPTLRSRCQALHVALPQPHVAATWLQQQHGVTEARALLDAAGGAPFEAIDRLALGVDAPAWHALPHDVASGQSTRLAAWPLPLVIDALQKLCHDAALRALGARPRYFAADAVPAGGDTRRLAACAAMLRTQSRHAEHPWNTGLAIEALVQQVSRALRPQPRSVHVGRQAEGRTPFDTLDR